MHLLKLGVANILGWLCIFKVASASTKSLMHWYLTRIWPLLKYTRKRHWMIQNKEMYFIKKN